jgi:hypothetical protein
VHYKYLDAWKIPNKIYVYDLAQKKAFEKTGRDVGGERSYNSFSFDEKVIELLRYAFSRKTSVAGPGQTYEVMLSFIEFMTNFDYRHKSDNVFEDFYGHFETRIGAALKSVAGRKQLLSADSTKEFDSLIFFFCLQLFRTPKARNLLSSEMTVLYHGEHQLSLAQKSDFIKAYLLICGIAMAVDMLNKGCQIRLHYSNEGGKLANCDAPAILNSQAGTQLNVISGLMPLSPRVLMEAYVTGGRLKSEFHENISSSEVERVNRRIINNAERLVYFSSANQRTKYLDQMNTLKVS